VENNTRKRTAQLLNKYGVTPQIRFSQNFLVDDLQIHKIVSSIPLEKIDQIIEIGPGIGSLTLPLINTGKDVVTIDFDRDMIKVLQGEFQHKNVQIIQGDFLKQDLSKFHVKHKAYIGNLPYQISRDLIKKILCESDFEYFGFMVQKELGEKMMYKYRSSTTNAYSVLLKMKGELELVTELKPICFYPSPKIDSWFLKIEPTSDYKIDIETFNIVSTIFKNPKKNIFNNFKNSKYRLSKDQLANIDILPTRRGHELTIEEIKRVVSLIKKAK